MRLIPMILSMKLKGLGCAVKWTLLLLASVLSVQVQGAARDEVVFFQPDILGSVVVAVIAVDEQGGLCWSNTYIPYGEKALIKAGSSAVCGLLGEERGFTGYAEYFESALDYAQQRYYDSSVSRFLSIAPVATDPDRTATINRYAYAANNPYEYADPSGETFKETVGALWNAVTDRWSSESTGVSVEDLRDALVNGYSEGGWEAFNSLVSDLDFISTISTAGLMKIAVQKLIAVAINMAKKGI